MTMKRKFELTKGKVIIAIAAVSLIAVAVYFFLPRELDAIVNCPNSVESISISQYESGYISEELKSLTGEDAAELLNVIKSAKVYLNPIYTKSDEGGSDTIGVDIKFVTKQKASTKSPLKIHVFTDDILIIDGVQYKLYGNEFIETLRTLIN